MEKSDLIHLCEELGFIYMESERYTYFYKKCKSYILVIVGDIPNITKTNILMFNKFNEVDAFIKNGYGPARFNVEFTYHSYKNPSTAVRQTILKHIVNDIREIELDTRNSKKVSFREYITVGDELCFPKTIAFDAVSGEKSYLSSINGYVTKKSM